jgi:hypothetical protein
LEEEFPIEFFIVYKCADDAYRALWFHGAHRHAPAARGNILGIRNF